MRESEEIKEIDNDIEKIRWRILQGVSLEEEDALEKMLEVMRKRKAALLKKL